MSTKRELESMPGAQSRLPYSSIVEESHRGSPALRFVTSVRNPLVLEEFPSLQMDASS